MSNVSHRRPTPVPTESVFVFGREISQLPAITESPRETSLTQYMEPSASSEVSKHTPGAVNAMPGSPVSNASVQSESERQESTSGGADNIPEEEVQLMAPSGATTDSVTLNISSHSLHNTESESSHDHPSNIKNGFVLRAPEEDIQDALLTLFFVVFHVAWSLGVGFWHLGDGHTNAAQLTFAIIIASEICTQITYFFNRSIPKGRIWSTSKLLWFILLIPCTLPIFMALTNLAFAVKESKDHTYVRPWTNTRTIFLVESLSLAFPQSVLQISILMEDYENFPSLKGAILAAGLFILSAGITYARIRYDSSERMDRFAVGTERYIRYAVVWASKVLWLITYCCLIVSIRIIYTKENIMAAIVSLVALQAFFEIPLFISTVNMCQRFSGVLFSSFFLIPQFAALVTLVFWVNVDMTVYKYNIGSCILGLFFGTESLAIMGWLLDRCMGRDIDFFPIYPHFFGNMYLRCCK